MSFTLVEDTTDVGFVRNMLVQAGRFATNIRDNDLYYVFQGVTGAIIYTDHQDLIDVAGIWAGDDITNSGTNYLSGASIYPTQGKIELSQPLASGTKEVLVTYAATQGLSDTQIQINLDTAKNFMIGELWADSLNFASGSSSTYDNMVRYTMLTVASYFSLLAINNSNAIQSGFNYRLGDFEIQTKLWGEGMIAETLLNKYWERSQKMLNALKLYQSKPDVGVYVINRKNTKLPYNKDPMIFNNPNISFGQSTIYDSQHRFGIIIKLEG